MQKGKKWKKEQKKERNEEKIMPKKEGKKVNKY